MRGRDTYGATDPTNKVDPNGELTFLAQVVGGAVVGGTIGFVGSVIGQAAKSDWNWKSVDLSQAGRAGVRGAIVGGLTAVGAGGVAGGVATRLIGGSATAGTAAYTTKMVENVVEERPATAGAATEGIYAAGSAFLGGVATRKVAAIGIDAAASRMHYIPSPGAAAERLGTAAGVGVNAATETAKAAAESPIKTSPTNTQGSSTRDCTPKADSAPC